MNAPFSSPASFFRLSRILDKFRLIERRCFACSRIHRPVPDAAGFFCNDCLATIPALTQGYCPRCGEPAPWPGAPVCTCSRCLTTPPPWTRIVFHGLYEGRLRELLLSLKFNDNVLMGHALGSLLAGHPGFATLNADVILPIPLHKNRLATRGYNQSLEIARPLARNLGLPLRSGLLTRIRATAPQSGSSLKERQRNILNAFACTRNIQDMRILLVDDTLTTGSTMAAASRALLAAGAAEVTVAVVSRTARHGMRLRLR